MDIAYRKGKDNVVADWLSRPPVAGHVITITTNNAATDDDVTNASEQREGGEGHLDQDISPSLDPPQPPADPPQVKVKLTQLNWLDLQAIFETLNSSNAPVPQNLSMEWIREHFVIYKNQLHRIHKQRLLRIPTYAELLVDASKIHRDQGHCSIGTVIRALDDMVWHPDLILAAQEAISSCPYCQLMKRPDPTPQHLTPISPPPPLQRWAIDHTGPIAGWQMLNAIEYVTGWAESTWVADTTSQTTVNQLERIRQRFGPMRELVSDNAGAFRGPETDAWRARHGVRLLPATPAHPRTNGRVERYNGIIKNILAKLALDDPTMSTLQLLHQAVYIYNRRPGQHGYSPYFLMYGVQPPSEPSEITQYVREPTQEEEAAFARELVQQGHAQQERQYVTSLKATRDEVRARLQEKKAWIRTFETGDWVLRTRQRAHKMEPFYDGPWAIAGCHAGNTYTLASPGGIRLRNKYNGAMLFPAYVQDGHPERSLWYASKRMLQQDRARQLADVGAAPLERIVEVE